MPKDGRRAVSFWKLQKTKPHPVLYFERASYSIDKPSALDRPCYPLACELHSARSTRYIVVRGVLNSWHGSPIRLDIEHKSGGSEGIGRLHFDAYTAVCVPVR